MTKALSFAKLLLAQNPIIAMGEMGAVALLDAMQSGDFSGFKVRAAALTDMAIAVNSEFSYYQTGRTVLIPISGVIVPKGTIFDCSYQAGIDDYQMAIDSALSNNKIDNIILVIDSGGGSAAGVEQFYNFIQRKKKIKPMAAYIETIAASAAYYIAAATDSVTLSGQTTIVGSIGTMVEITDFSGMLAANGITTRNVLATKSYNKRMPNDATAAEIDANLVSELLDPFNEIFLSNVRKGRANTIDKINATIDVTGNPKALSGATYMGSAAIKAGLADKIGTLQMAINQFAKINNNTNSFNQISTNMSFLDKIKAVFAEDAITANEDIATAFEDAKGATLELAAKLDAANAVIATFEKTEELMAAHAKDLAAQNDLLAEKQAELTAAANTAQAELVAAQKQVADLELLTRSLPKINTAAGVETETQTEANLREARERIKNGGF